jgi:broad specificity phosphatase PhoE
VLRAAGLGAALAAFPALLGFAPSPRPPVAGVPVTAPRGKVILIIRHGEKPTKAPVPPGIDLAGEPDTRSLTEQGWMRAASLVGLFVPRPDSGRAALPRPRMIYASGTGDGGGEGNRPRQTVRPVAIALHVPVDTTFSRGDEVRLITRAAAEPGPTLICWQHGEIPTMAATFANVAPAASRTWPDSRYDVVWAFTSTGSGWRFQKVAEQLLPGDATTGIA